MKGVKRFFLIIVTIVAVSRFPVAVTIAGEPKTAKIIDLGAVIEASDGARFLSVSERREVVGAADFEGTNQAFLYSHGVKTNLGTLGGSTSLGFGISARGHVVGAAETNTGATHAFLYTSGNMQDLGTLGGSTSGAYAINDREQVVGYSSLTGDQEFHPFWFTNGEMIDLGSLGGNGIALGINNRGQIVGFSFLSDNQNYRAFVHENGVMSDLGTLGGVFSYARAINSRGDIVGFADGGDGTAHAFFHSDGHMNDLGTFGFAGSDAHAINDTGQVVGTVRQSSGDTLAILFDHGEGILLNSLLPTDSGWSLTGAFGINNSGLIVGVGYHNGELRAYSLTLPEGKASFLN